MSERLLGIAADVLRSFGSAFGSKHLAIIGGAVPGLLVSTPPVAASNPTSEPVTSISTYRCTSSTARPPTTTKRSSTACGPSVSDADDESGREVKWRWIGWYRDVRLQVELLCPVRSRAGRPERPAVETPAEANIGPSGEITALAVGFGHLVLDDTISISRRVESAGGGLTYEFPVAGLTSWLCLKSDAIMRRDKLKDAYDVVWILDALGPDAATDMVAASPLLGGPFADEVRAQLALLIDDQFQDEESVGPTAYAAFLEAQPAGGARRHALGTVVAFGRTLARAGLVVSELPIRVGWATSRVRRPVSRDRAARARTCARRREDARFPRRPLTRARHRSPHDDDARRRRKFPIELPVSTTKSGVLNATRCARRCA